jgi:hypothetical protein
LGQIADPEISLKIEKFDFDIKQDSENTNLL